MFLILIVLLKYISSSHLNETDIDVHEEINEFEHFLKAPAIQISEVDLDEYLKFLEKDESCNSNDYVSANNLDEYAKELYENIVKYINDNLYNVQCKIYIKKLNCIRMTLGKISKDLKEESEAFAPEIDNDLISLLNYLKSTYSNRLKLDNETYLNFMINLDYKFSETKKRNRVKYKALQMNIDSRPNVLLYEFLKIYKYIKRFPELLIFGFVFEYFYLKKVIIPIHFIELFLSQNEEMSIENEIFFIFLLKKAFSYTSKQHIDLINAKKIQLSSSIDISGLYFFAWEFNYRNRKRLQSYLTQYDKDNSYFSEEDKTHLNIVFRLYLFQHLTYLKYKSVQNKEFEEFKKFVDKVFVEPNNYVSHFYEFINLI